MSYTNIVYLILGNITLLVVIVSSIFCFMLISGYKSITIKFKKYKQLKELNKKQEVEEQKYISTLENNIKKLKKKKK